MFWAKDNRNRFQITKEDIGVVLDEAYFPESITAKQVKRGYAEYLQEME